MSNLNPINTVNDVGMSIYGGYMCDTILEPTIVSLNSNIIGKIGGNDYNGNYICGGVVGSFDYQNNLLFGLGDDTPDNTMKESDGLVNIKNYLTYLTTGLNANFEVQSNNGNYWFTNPVWGVTLTYTPLRYLFRFRSQ